ncbi:MAG: histidine kinase [Hymenobacter sp.]|nr:histidine kinase [Hymenobacter sp.]
MDAFLRWFRWLGIPLVGLLFFGALVIVYPEEQTDNPPWGSLNRETLAALTMGVLLSYLTFETGILLARYLDRHLAWAHRPGRRVLLQMGLQTALALLMTLGAGLLYVRLGGYDTPAQPVRLTDLLPLLLVALFTAFLLAGTYIGASFFAYWQAEIIAREAAAAQAAQARLQALQQQLDPHFLFNTLNTLTAVIEEDPPRAVTFVQRLATVYRYVLQHQHGPAVAVHEELRLAQAYLYLLQTRYPDGLRLAVAVDPVHHPRRLLPMVLQLLLENAIKHNCIEPDRPLLIRLYSQGEWLVVENNRQPLPRQAPSTGLGLRNVTRRYEAAGAGPVRVEATEALFRVSIPLLPE